MAGWRAWIVLGVMGAVSLGHGCRAFASADLRLDKDFISGIIEKLPEARFEQEGQLRGTVHGFRLLAIEPRARQLVVACQIEGEFRAPVNGPITDRIARSRQTPQGLAEIQLRHQGAGSTSSPAATGARGSGSASTRSNAGSWTASAGSSRRSSASSSTT